MYIAKKIKVVNISIHAPRAGGDFLYIAKKIKVVNISIHAPRAGGDQYILTAYWIT